MVIKGISCAGARRLATHLARTDTNERAEVRELRGVTAENLRGALLEMEAVAAGTRATKPFYHGSINTRADEKLTDEQRDRAIDRLEEKLGLSGQSRVVVVHFKGGREHCHIVWSRIDLDRMRAISDSHNYRKHEEVARDLEREFGHERVQGAHAERDGKPRPERTPSHSEMLQAERGAASPREAKALITEIWRHTDNGQSFKAALENREWLLAKGDRRDFVVIDPHGGTHSLARRVDDAKAKDIRARMADIDPELLPSVAEARVRQRDRQNKRPDPENSRNVMASSAMQQPEQNGPTERSSFVIQIDHDFTEAEAKREEALKQLAKAARSDQRMLRDRAPGEMTAERAFGDSARDQAAEMRAQYREEKLTADQASWRKSRVENNSDNAKPVAKGLQVLDSVTGMITSLGDFLIDFMAGSSGNPQEPPGAKKGFDSDFASEEQQLVRLAAAQSEREAASAIERMARDMEEGRSLNAQDVRRLTPQHQQQIRQFGDDAVRQMVDEFREYNERFLKGKDRELE